MDIKEIKQLISLMASNDLTELDITDGDKKVTLKRSAGGVPVMTMAPVMSAPMPAAVPAAAPVAAAAAAPAAPAEKLLEVKSPMVGTFYAAPSPDSESYVKVGASITDSTTVCIIEAMKVMNEIKAECSGVVAEICVKNAQPVEFGQVLFRVRPA